MHTLIEKIKEKIFWQATLVFVFLISPPLLVLFYFQRELFLSLDTFKIILFTISISAPIHLWNGLLFGFSESINKFTKKSEDKQEDSFLFKDFATAIFLGGLVLYVVLAFSYLNGWRLKTLLWIVAVIEIITTILLVLRAVQKVKKIKL